MELFQELGDGDGGEVVGLHRSRRKVIQGFIYLKLNYLFSGFPILLHGYGVWVLVKYITANAKTKGSLLTVLPLPPLQLLIRPARDARANSIIHA